MLPNKVTQGPYKMKMKNNRHTNKQIKSYFIEANPSLKTLQFKAYTTYFYIRNENPVVGVQVTMSRKSLAGCILFFPGSWWLWCVQKMLKFYSNCTHLLICQTHRQINWSIIISLKVEDIVEVSWNCKICAWFNIDLEIWNKQKIKEDFSNCTVQYIVQVQYIFNIFLHVLL